MSRVIKSPSISTEVYHVPESALRGSNPGEGGSEPFDGEARAHDHAFGLAGQIARGALHIAADHDPVDRRAGEENERRHARRSGDTQIRQSARTLARAEPLRSPAPTAGCPEQQSRTGIGATASGSSPEETAAPPFPASFRSA